MFSRCLNLEQYLIFSLPCKKIWFELITWKFLSEGFPAGNDVSLQNRGHRYKEEVLVQELPSRVILEHNAQGCRDTLSCHTVYMVFVLMLRMMNFFCFIFFLSLYFILQKSKPDVVTYLSDNGKLCNCFLWIILNIVIAHHIPALQQRKILCLL